MQISVYQDKFNRGDNTGTSNHLLKYAARTTFFDPAITETEFLSAIRSHYPVKIKYPESPTNLEQFRKL
jgi:hypothetical protein